MMYSPSIPRTSKLMPLKNDNSTTTVVQPGTVTSRRRRPDSGRHSRRCHGAWQAGPEEEAMLGKIAAMADAFFASGGQELHRVLLDAEQDEPITRAAALRE